MTYPYIGKSTRNETVVLFASKGAGVQLNHENAKYSEAWDEDAFKNITADYLHNTKIKIESDEHKEFILKVLNVNGLCFSYLSGDSFICISDAENTIFHNPKLITLPLPPKESEEWPAVGDEVLTASNQRVTVIGIHGTALWIKYTKPEFVDFNTVGIGSVKKPPTPEEEIENLISIWMGENKATIGDGKLSKAIINGEIKGLSYEKE